MNKAILLICLTLGFFTGKAYGAESESRTYGPVQPNETLYRIALKYRQTGVTVAQIMMSIFQQNPGAFDRGNINRLKVGAVLEIPDFDTASGPDRNQALREATEQTQIFEKQKRELKVQRGEVEPLSQQLRNPDLATGIDLPRPVAEAPPAQALTIANLPPAKIELPEPKPPRQINRSRLAQPLFRYSYDMSVIDDDNVRQAQNDSDIRGDTIFSPMLKARAGKSLDSFTIWNYGGSITYHQFSTFDELDHFEYEVNTRYRVAFSSGFGAPIYSFGAKLGGLGFESEMRDSTLVSLFAEMNKALTDSLKMTAGLRFNERISVSEVFDTSESRVFVNFDTEFSRRDLMYTTLTFITGDTVSSATPTLDIINAADAIEPDDAFGGIAANQFAYRLDADSWVLTLGYNRILSRDLSLDLSARFVDTEASADAAIGYQRTQLRASLLGRF